MKPELIGAARNPLSRKYKKPSAIDYKMKAQRFEADGKTDLMNIALDEAFHIAQAKGENDANQNAITIDG